MRNGGRVESTLVGINSSASVKVLRSTKSLWKGRIQRRPEGLEREEGGGDFPELPVRQKVAVPKAMLGHRRESTKRHD